jgi:hypothetical protein
MRTRSPDCCEVINWTGVPKSATSRRRRRPSGSVDLVNSTTRFLPCCLTSTPTWLFGRSTITRPVLSLPRRKSTSRSGNVSRLRFSAKAVAAEAASAVPGHRLENDQQRLALDLGLVRRGLLQVQHHPAALAGLHHVHRTQVALVHFNGGAADGIRDAREVERDARRRLHGKSGRHRGERLRQIDADHFRPIASSWSQPRSRFAHGLHANAPKASRPSPAARSHCAIVDFFWFISFHSLAAAASRRVRSIHRRRLARFRASRLRFR